MSSKATYFAVTLALGGLSDGCGETRHDSTSPGFHTAFARAAQRQSGGVRFHAVSRRTLAKWDHDGDAGPADQDVPKSLYDGDDGEVRYFGYPAGASDVHSLSALADRYDRAVAAHDGATACSLIDAGLVRALLEQDHRTPGQSRACAVLMSTMFERVPARLTDDLAAVKTVGVRVNGGEGLVLLRLPNSEVHDIPVGRQSGAWKIEAFLDSGLS